MLEEFDYLLVVGEKGSVEGHTALRGSVKAPACKRVDKVLGFWSAV